MAQEPGDASELAPLTAETDKGGQAPALKHCPHLSDSCLAVPDDLSVFRGFKDITCDVADCKETECWMCCKCYKILCGRYARKHMLEHYKTETNGEHCIAMSMGDSEFWCFKCLILKIPLDEIPEDVRDDVMGAYLDDGAIPKVFQFYEQAHLAHWGHLPPSSASNPNSGHNTSSSLPPVAEDADNADDTNDADERKDATGPAGAANESDAKEVGKDAKAAETVEVARRPFDVDLDGLARVADLSSSATGVVKDENLNKTGIFYHDDMALHKAGFYEHVECPGRIEKSYENLQMYGLLKRCTEFKCKQMDLNLIELTHPKQHIAKILRGYDPTKKDAKPNDLAPGEIDGDTFYNQHTPKAALLAAGGFYESLEKVCITEEVDNGFALVRPPGHHACEKQAMGFCHFNNVVVGINALKKQYADNPKCPKKVLIVDWDVHHGNGTQDLTYDDNEILYFSIHRYQHGFYPGTGAIEETGASKKGKKGKKGKKASKTESQTDDAAAGAAASYDASSAEGKNLNVTMKGGMGDYEYLLVWRDILLPIAREFAPDLIVVSAGFDACTGDPLGWMRVTPPCYGELTRQLLQVQSKLVILLEGGYNLESMPKAVCCCVHALLTANAAKIADAQESKEVEDDAQQVQQVQQVQQQQKRLHSCMTPLLEVEDDDGWQQKMHAGFELSETSKQDWSPNEVLLAERAFGYVTGCLECLSEWSKERKDEKGSGLVVQFHKEWMKHYSKRAGMVGSRGWYKTQIPKGRDIDFIVESVLDAHIKYWPHMMPMKQKYEKIGDVNFAKEMQDKLNIN